jgi:hypothetical protein
VRGDRSLVSRLAPQAALGMQLVSRGGSPASADASRAAALDQIAKGAGQYSYRKVVAHVTHPDHLLPDNEITAAARRHCRTTPGWRNTTPTSNATRYMETAETMHTAFANTAYRGAPPGRRRPRSPLGDVARDRGVNRGRFHEDGEAVSS